MKEIVLEISSNYFNDIKNIFFKHKVETFSYYLIKCKYNSNRKQYFEIIDNYMTGKKLTLEFQSMIKVESIVSDFVLKEIINELSAIFKENDITGKVILKDVADIYDIKSLSNVSQIRI